MAELTPETREMNERVPSAGVRSRTELAVPIQERHISEARQWSLRLAREEIASGG